MINWKVRFKQKTFLVALFSALLLAAQSIFSVFGYDLTGDISDKITTIFNSILTVLTILGVMIDPTVSGLNDSQQALKYTSPKKK